MFMVLSSWQSHCERSPGSFDECRMAPSGRRVRPRPSQTRLWVRMYRLPETTPIIAIYYYYSGRKLILKMLATYGRSHWNSHNSGQTEKMSSWEFCMCAVLHYNVYYLCKMHQNTVFAVLCLCRKFYLRKSTKTVAIGAAPFRPRYEPNRLSLGLCPRTHWGSLQRSPRPTSWFRGGPLRKGRRGKEEEKRGRRGRGGERNNMRGDGHPRFSDELTPL